MAFTKALYYPSIDIQNEGWLKNALLYWDKMQTIVPRSIQQPYSTRTAREFKDEGLLLPFYVSPDMREIVELRDDVLRYLESPEGTEILLRREFPQGSFFYTDIHADKLLAEVRQRVERGLRYQTTDKQQPHPSDEWVKVDIGFANFYMTLLATYISKTIGAGLLTNISAISKLATAVRLNAYQPFPIRLRYGAVLHRDMPLSLAQGILSDLVFERIQIAPDTPVRKILKFRNDHADELGRFRTKVAELTQVVSRNQPIELLRQQIEDIYINEVKPAIHSLKASLNGSRIKWATENFLKVAFFSSGPTFVLNALLDSSGPYALLAGAGISVTASAILYNREKAETLRQNPFSFVLAAEKAFH